MDLLGDAHLLHLAVTPALLGDVQLLHRLPTSSMEAFLVTVLEAVQLGEADGENLEYCRSLFNDNALRILVSVAKGSYSNASKQAAAAAAGVLQVVASDAAMRAVVLKAGYVL